MLKPVIAATALAALAGSSIAYAQHSFGDGDCGFGDRGPHAEYRHHLTTADISAFADARIAALKAGLQLTPDQEKNWPPFEQALRDMVQRRIQRVQARQAAGDQQQQGTPFDRLSQGADNMAKTSAALKKIADTGAPLYQSLNDDQKNRFVLLAHILRPHYGMGGGMDGERNHGWGGEHEHGWGGDHERD